MKYIKVEWPEIQDYMDNPEYPEECYFDPQKNCWFVPEVWIEDEWLLQREENEFEMYNCGDIGDLEDALG